MGALMVLAGGSHTDATLWINDAIIFGTTEDLFVVNAQNFRLKFNLRFTAAYEKM